MVDVATDEAEGGQALFCYIADILGETQTKKIFPIYIKSKDFDKFLKHPWPGRNGKNINDLIEEGYSTSRVDTGKTKNTILSYLNKKEDWFISSLLIGQKIIETINKIDSDFANIKKPGWNNLYYQHGDEDVMGVMTSLFKKANDQSENISKFLKKKIKTFGNINKWTPADIYFASQNAKDILKNLLNDEQTIKGNMSFDDLNGTISKLIKSGDLLPLSLKKAKNDVIIKKVNFSPATEKKLLEEVKCTGVEKWTPMKADYTISGNKFKWGKKEYSGGRDIYIKLKEGTKDVTIQIRHTPATGGKPIEGVKIVLKYAGSSALAGQIVGIPLLTNLIHTVDKTFSSKLKNTFDTKYKLFKAAAEKYIATGGGKQNYMSKDKEKKKKFNDDIGALSGHIIMNPLRKVIDEYFKNPKSTQHKVVRAIWQYSASRSLDSAKFIIAKD